MEDKPAQREAKLTKQYECRWNGTNLIDEQHFQRVKGIPATLRRTLTDGNSSRFMGSMREIYFVEV